MGLPDRRRNTGRSYDQATYEAACVEALKLRTNGMSYRMIAEAQGISVGQAHNRVTHAIRAGGKKDADTERQLDLERLDGYLMVIHERMRQGDVKAMEIAMRVMDRRARLLGLDVPVKVDATVTVQDAMDAELADVVNEAKMAWDAEDRANEHQA